ncbi:hypothetical protein ACTFIU_008256 [Dictyostelium citrinum]
MEINRKRAEERNIKTKERIEKREKNLHEKEERIKNSFKMGQEVKFVTEESRNNFQALSSNSTYHREKAFNRIEECEVQSLQIQKEIADMVLVIKMFFNSHVNVTQHFSPPLLTPPPQPT